MSQWNALKKTYRMAKQLKEQRGGFMPGYFWDAVCCGYRHQASPENYFVLRFYELSDSERAAYLTSGRSSKADRQLNVRMTCDENKIMSHKHLFYQTFSGLVRREYLYVPDVASQEFEEFLRKNAWVVIKPDRGIMGHGIEKICADEVQDVQAFYEKCKTQKYLLEQVITQHPCLEQIMPGCVNSVRINAARDRQGAVRLIGACLKCGGKGAVADNFHSGGIAYPLDLKRGIVTGSGKNNAEIRAYERHPGTEFFMPGLEIPYWKEILNSVFAAMDRLPNVGYVGWDIAVTPHGPELIEGNCHFPGGNIIQLDGIGKYPLIKECLGEIE